MSYVVEILNRFSEKDWMGYAQTSAVVDGPASPLRPNQSPKEMADLMLANSQNQAAVALRNMQYLLNHTTYRMSHEFRGKVQAAMRIISGGPL